MELLTPEAGLFFWVIFTLLVIILPVFSIIHLLQHRNAKADAKLIWVLIILLLPVLGSVLYFIMGRSRVNQV